MLAQSRKNYKLGFVLPYLTAAGGVRRNFEMANRLAKLGYDVCIYSDDTGHQWFPLEVPILKLAELDKPHDAVFTGWPLFENYLYETIQAKKKFWLMQGYVPEYDKRFILDPDYIKIAASTYLYQVAKQLGSTAYPCIGAVNLEQFYPVKVEKKNFALYNPLKNGKIIAALCQKIGLEAKPLFNVKQEHLKFVYSCAAMYISAELESSGWSNPVAEAMACKCPVISTASGAVMDLVINGETGLYFDLEDCASFQNCVNSVIKQTQNSQNRVENAFVNVKQYSWDQLVNRLDVIIQQELNTTVPTDTVTLNKKKS